MIATILDQDRMERVIFSYREQEVSMPDFELQDVTREGNRLEWVFFREILEDLPNVDVLLMVFEDAPMVRLVPRAGLHAEAGDTMTMRYYIHWWWEGPDGDVRLPEPVPGATFHWETIAA